MLPTVAQLQLSCTKLKALYDQMSDALLHMVDFNEQGSDRPEQ